MPSANASQWLLNSSSIAPTSSYYHFHLVENCTTWAGVQEELINYFKNAHADAIGYLNRIFGSSLHPAGAKMPPPDLGYPWKLPQKTLQGYFGEVMAGWFAENYSPCGLTDWLVPAHLFSCHLQAFQHLGRLAQNKEAPSEIPGRTGDDCLAFRRNETGQITDILYCEAKCTKTHDSGLIADAHQNAALGAITDIPQLIDILIERGDPLAASWVNPLRQYNLELLLNSTSSTVRHDLVCYVHGKEPKVNSTWIPSTSKHNKYTETRVLNVVELRLINVLSRIQTVYDSAVWT